MTNPDYVPKAWHSILIMFAILSAVSAFNAFMASKLPLLEGIVVVIHICGLLVILIILWVLADVSPARQVFTTFNNGGGWSTQGASCLVGILSPVFSFVGPDAACHIAKELRDAGRTLPRAMIWTAIVDGVLGFVALVTFCMTIGDVETALNSPTGFACIDVSCDNQESHGVLLTINQLFYKETHSKAGTWVMSALFIIMLLFGCVTNLATSSRQLWAFVSGTLYRPSHYRQH